MVEITQFLSAVLDELQRYSSLILVIITGVYAFLTWRMVREMRRAREAEAEPHLVTALVLPYGPGETKLRVENAGRGPALKIMARISLEPPGKTQAYEWCHPVLVSEAHKDLLLPGDELNPKKLVAAHERVVVELQWSNVFEGRRSDTIEIDLKQHLEGWAKARVLRDPDDAPTQLNRIHKQLKSIADYLRHQESELRTGKQLEKYRDGRKWWVRLWYWLSDLVARIAGRRPH